MKTERKQMQMVDIFEMVRSEDDGSVSHSLVGRGADGTVWMEAGFLNLDADIFRELCRDRPQSVKLDTATGRTMIELGALAAQCPVPNMQKTLLAWVEHFREALHPTNFRQ
jgi:hypothetical protein